MLAALTLEARFDDGRMSCEPWQLAQLATSTAPPRAARPWKLSAKVCARSRGRFHFSVRRSEPWQEEQTRAETFRAATGDFGSFGERMLCSPWQSVQAGASLFPLRSAMPWTLAENAWFSFAWHFAQTCCTCILLTVEERSKPWRASC